MKQIIIFFLIIFIFAYWKYNIKTEKKQIEAIQKQNDSINSVKYLNRETKN